MKKTAKIIYEELRAALITYQDDINALSNIDERNKALQYGIITCVELSTTLIFLELLCYCEVHEAKNEAIEIMESTVESVLSKFTVEQGTLH